MVQKVLMCSCIAAQLWQLLPLLLLLATIAVVDFLLVNNPNENRQIDEFLGRLSMELASESARAYSTPAVLNLSMRLLWSKSSYSGLRICESVVMVEPDIDEKAMFVLL